MGSEWAAPRFARRARGACLLAPSLVRVSGTSRGPLLIPLAIADPCRWCR